MYIGTAMKNSEYGSWLGVMTAANVTMPTIAQRRALRSCAVFRTPAISRKTRMTGNSNDSPNATTMSETRVRYLSDVYCGVCDGPPTWMRNFSAGSRVRNATAAPSAKSTSDESTNGTAYLRSFGLRPG